MITVNGTSEHHKTMIFNYLATAVHIIGILIIIFGFFSPGVLSEVFSLNDYMDTSTPDSLVFIAPVLLLLMGGAIIKLSRKLRALAAQKILRTDTRDIVLFLRSFADDTKISITHQSKNDIFLPFIGVVSIIRIILGRNKISFEEGLVQTISRTVGPTIAIGRPGEYLPPTGAIRHYVKDENWKQVVLEKMKTARLTVIQIAEPSRTKGKGKGLEWEIKTALDTVHPSNILFIFYEDWMAITAGDINAHLLKEKHFTYFRELVQEYEFASRLPDTMGSSVFLYFDSDWTPRLLPPVYYRPVESAYLGYAVNMSESLQPFLDSLLARYNI